MNNDLFFAGVVAGGFQSSAFDSSRFRWAWGFNGGGQLGDGTQTNKNTPTKSGTDVDWERLAGGLGHTLALKRDGSMWGWGFNDARQLGDVPIQTRFASERQLTGPLSHVALPTRWR